MLIWKFIDVIETLSYLLDLCTLKSKIIYSRDIEIQELLVLVYNSFCWFENIKICIVLLNIYILVPTIYMIS